MNLDEIAQTILPTASYGWSRTWVKVRQVSGGKACVTSTLAHPWGSSRQPFLQVIFKRVTDAMADSAGTPWVVLADPAPIHVAAFVSCTCRQAVRGTCSLWTEPFARSAFT